MIPRIHVDLFCFTLCLMGKIQNLVWKRNTITVRKDEKKEDIIKGAMHYLGAITIDKEVMWETVSVEPE